MNDDLSKRVYSVSQVNRYIKRVFEANSNLSSISIKGEVSNRKVSGGHLYFSLKDEGAQIACVMFSSSYTKLKTKIEDGMKIVASGNITVFERDGRYQLYCNDIEISGIGNLYERYELLKKKLLEEGLFDASHKKEIPKYIKTLGIVTAGNGAAIQDICNITKRRNPYVTPILVPVKVQGEGAAAEIAAAIKKLDKYGVDVMIVGRGGGSIEDLWAFNEEIVARAVYNCSTPVISAVGHETDTTIIDYVSDLRAPTPSAGAELAVYMIDQFDHQMALYHEAFTSKMLTEISAKRDLIENKKLKLANKSPRNVLLGKKQNLDAYSLSFSKEIHKKIDINKHKIDLYIEKLKSASPLNRLKSGYAYVTKDDVRVTSYKDVKVNDDIKLDLPDGSVYAKVNKVDTRGNIYG